MPACPSIRVGICTFTWSTAQTWVKTELVLHLQGRVYEPGEVRDEMAEAIRDFNQHIISDPRVDVVCLPFRDGVSIVTRK